MGRTGTWFAIATMLIIAAPTVTLAKERNSRAAAPSVAKGDPPPGNAASLSVAQAKAMLEDGIRKRYVGNLKERYSFAVSTTYVAYEATDIRVRASGFEFNAPYSMGGVSQPGKVLVNFKRKSITPNRERCEVAAEDYLEVYRPDLGKTTSRVDAGLAWGHDKIVYPTPLYSVAYLPDPEHAVDMFQCLAGNAAILAWTDEAAAHAFADGFNRLLYAAHRNEIDPEFIAAAKAWRGNPVKPPLSDEAERERILAENAIREKDLDSAAQHFENALEIQPTWPEGWFNLALIYGEQSKFAEASDRMKHYLELVPDAADAKDARQQLVIWEDKAKR